MSRLFGPVVQQGYVVPDIDAAMKHWLARGIGPFFIEHHRNLEAWIDGRDGKVELKAAFAYSGEQQIEVIQPLGDTPTIYTEFLAREPGGGLQHLAVWVDDIDDTVAQLKADGANYVVRQRYGAWHAYLDCEDFPGTMIQLMARAPINDALFAIVREGADSWNGHSDPVRHLDWSTGMPRVRDA